MLANPVPYALNELGRNIRSGLSSIGNYPLQKAQLGLQEAQIKNDIGRQRELDALRRPGLELAAQKARNEMDVLNTPLNIGDLAAGVYGEKPSRETISHTVSNGYLQDILKMTGAKVSPNGTIIKRDGTIATGRDVERFGPVLQTVMAGKSDPGHKLDQRIREIEEHHDITNLNPKQKAFYERAKQLKSDQKWLIGKYGEQIEQLERAKAVLAGRGGIRDFSIIDGYINRAKGKAAALQGQIAKEDERKFEREKMAYDRETKLMLKNMDQLNKDVEKGNKTKEQQFKYAQDLYKHFTKQTSESAVTILAKMYAGQVTGDTEIQSVKDELSEADQKLFDRVVEILNDYYGVKETPAEIKNKKQEQPYTHEFIFGKGLVPAQ